jgi:hypothetical protein
VVLGVTRRTHAFILIVAASALLVGCGGSSSGAPNGATSTGSSASGDRSEFQQCLKEHGVELPSGAGSGFSGGPPGDFSGPPPDGFSGAPGGGTPPSLPAGVDSQAFQSAMQACQSLAPAGGRGGPGGQAFQAYTSCLADHGVNVASASTDSGASDAPGSASGPPPSFDRNDPAFEAANQVCQALLPQGQATTTTVVP